MATKNKTPSEEKFEKQDFNLFDALAALDNKDYGYYDRLTPEQQKGFAPFMMIKWMSAIKGAEGIARYYTMSTEYSANKYFFDENVQKHPKLQWLMLCAASPGLKKQFHQWIPSISEKVSKLQDAAKAKDIQDYFKKIYPSASASDLKEISAAFVADHDRKRYFATRFPNMKFSDIELLNQITTDEEIERYERDHGNG